tara:strand:- start:50 stop:919 length:870 start_codon:yes stop_codon:yes gene_type:complete
MNILLTGVNGLLGSSLASLLVKKNHNVYGIARDDNYEKIKKVKYIKLDFSRRWGFKDLPSKLDVIIHLAQSNQFRNFPDKASDVFKVNIESTARLLDFCYKSQVKKFIYTSSGGVYGNSKRPFSEKESIITPGELGYYLGSKASSETLIESYSSHFTTIILRPFFIYGPRQNRSMLVPRMIDNIANGNPIFLQGRNGIRINPIYVDDAALSVYKSMQIKKSEIYNIGGPEILSIKEIAEGISSYLKTEPNFQKIPGPALDLISDITKMKKELHSPKIKIFDTLNFFKTS